MCDGGEGGRAPGQGSGGCAPVVVDEESQGFEVVRMVSRLSRGRRCGLLRCRRGAEMRRWRR